MKELMLLRTLTSDLRTELCSILEKLGELASTEKDSSINQVSRTASANSNVSTNRDYKIQVTLPALREALQRLTVLNQNSASPGSVRLILLAD